MPACHVAKPSILYCQAKAWEPREKNQWRQKGRSALQAVSARLSRSDDGLSTGYRAYLPRNSLLIGLGEMVIPDLSFFTCASPEVNAMQTAKQAAKQLIDHLPDQVTWDDIMYELYTKQKIEQGLQGLADNHQI
jgi:hypothetical protein